MSTESDLAVGFNPPAALNMDPQSFTGDGISSPGSQRPPAGIDSHDRPDAAGWSSAATAIHSLWKMPMPMLLVLEPAGLGAIVIDVAHNEFAWEVPLELFPTDPASVGVYTQAAPVGLGSVSTRFARNLDGLLWKIGLNSFGGELAWWLPEGERYHVSRWPNLTQLAHSWTQVRTIAMLANAYFSIAELTAAAALTSGEARRLLNALSLIGILESSSTQPEPLPQPVLDVASRGLFHRLLDRLSSHG